MSREQFSKHWRHVHAALCKKLPNLLRYSVNLVDRKRFPEFGYDGFSELWFESEESMRSSLASADETVLLADLPNFTAHIYPIVSHEYHQIWA